MAKPPPISKECTKVYIVSWYNDIVETDQSKRPIQGLFSIGVISMAVHPCPRCKRLLPVGVAYCEACRPMAEAQAVEAMERKRAYKQRQYNAKYNRRRDPKYLTFYRSKDWRTMSRAKLQSAGYKCQAGLEGCSRIAVEVHHVKPIQTAEGWPLRLEWSNLEALCINCHNKRHDRGKQRRDSSVIDMRYLDL